MRRQRLRKQAVGLSLFSFLAVLICTMGALIVLLVVTVQQARVQAKSIIQSEAASRQQAADAESERHLQRETSQWKLQLLQESRQKTALQLSQQRLRLSHLEDHLRRLRDRLQQLSAEAEQMRNVDDNRRIDQNAAREELAKLHGQIAAAQRQLDQSVQKARNHPQSFIIIPYLGKNGTHRRPIYIECLEDRIVLQPEGVELTMDDFQPPLGPGNPLAAALRGTREYLARTDTLGSGGEPYPLLIVRPDGSNMYAAARSALKSWDTEFGYELVREDIKLAYPPADPLLADLQRRTLEDVRRRRRLLARAAPTRYGHLQGPYISTTRSHGGFQVHGDVGQLRKRRGAAGGGGGSGERSEEPGKGHTTAHSDGKQSAMAFPENKTGQHSADQHSAGRYPSNNGKDNNNAQEAGTGGGMSSMALQRGKDWGLPNAADGSTGFTRPIRVAVHQDRVVILPERETGNQPVVIPFHGSTRSGVDAMVSTIWKHIESWGIAGPGAYWKPVLNIDVAPQGDRRFDEITILLEGSGIDMKRNPR